MEANTGWVNATGPGGSRFGVGFSGGWLRASKRSTPHVTMLLLRLTE